MCTLENTQPYTYIAAIKLCALMHIVIYVREFYVTSDLQLCNDIVRHCLQLIHIVISPFTETIRLY